jgi:hypothetical protein
VLHAYEKGSVDLQKIVKMTNSHRKTLCFVFQMMGLLIITCFRGHIKCSHGVVRDVTLM